MRAVTPTAFAASSTSRASCGRRPLAGKLAGIAEAAGRSLGFAAVSLSLYRLAEQLLAERPGTRVVFTPGHTEDAIVGHGVLRRGTAFLEKPFSASALARTLRGLLDDARAA